MIRKPLPGIRGSQEQDCLYKRTTNFSGGPVDAFVRFKALKAVLDVSLEPVMNFLR